MDRTQDKHEDRTDTDPMSQLRQMVAMLEELKKEHAATTKQLDLINAREKEAKEQAKAQSKATRTNKKSNKTLVDLADGELRYVKVGRDKRKVVHHYHAHYDPRFERKPAKRDEESERYAFCYFCQHAHTVNTMSYYDLGPIIGRHWLCRESASMFGAQEVIIHV